MKKKEIEAKLERVRKELMKHSSCGEHHRIDGKRATCLDVILLECFGGDDSYVQKTRQDGEINISINQLRQLADELEEEGNGKDGINPGLDQKWCVRMRTTGDNEMDTWEIDWELWDEDKPVYIPKSIKKVEKEMYCLTCGMVDDSYSAYCGKCGRSSHMIRKVRT